MAELSMRDDVKPPVSGRLPEDYKVIPMLCGIYVDSGWSLKSGEGPTVEQEREWIAALLHHFNIKKVRY